MFKKIVSLSLIASMLVLQTTPSMAVGFDEEGSFGCLSFLRSFFIQESEDAFTEEELEEAAEDIKKSPELALEPKIKHIEELPVDMLKEIVSYLDFNSLSRLRATDNLFKNLIDNEIEFESKKKSGVQLESYVKLGSLLTEWANYESTIDPKLGIRDLGRNLQDQNFLFFSSVKKPYKERALNYQKSLQKQKWNDAGIFEKWEMFKGIGTNFAFKFIAVGMGLFWGVCFIDANNTASSFEQRVKFENLLTPMNIILFYSFIGALSLIERFLVASGKHLSTDG